MGWAAVGSSRDRCEQERYQRQHHRQQLQGEVIGTLRPRKRQCREEEERSCRRQAEATGFGQAAHLGRIAGGRPYRDGLPGSQFSG